MLNKWDRVGFRKRAGVVAPLFSLYSKKSAGIGDFEDLKLLIDWSEKTGNSVIQLLPMNEMGVLFCPYDSLSSFGLEPAYICLDKVRGSGDNSFRLRIEKLRKQFALRGKTYVDYRIKEEKTKLLWDIYIRNNLDSFDELRQFKENNAYWLSDFALFNVIKDYYKGRAWYEWEDKYKNRDPLELENFSKTYEKEINFQIWLQWIAFRQFKEAKDYANSKNVFIKGDLPILVSRDSADAWAHPEFFKLDFAAGAPSDMYCAKGQRWGMPTYNWQNIALDEFRYLKHKLKYAENFYDILRVDHVVGLFRIWSIPYNEPQENKGLHGFFDPKDESRWGEHGRKILSVMLENTNMLLCAEDLGIIPKVCRDTLNEMRIPGNDVQRWMKDWSVKHDFLKPQEYRQLSVAMLSTHDTTNWPAWWENEAGTVDEELFIRKCNEKKIDYAAVKDKLFDLNLSRHKRLRWLNSVDSIDKLTAILGKKKEEVGDFIDIYKNTYREKEKLWQHLKLKGTMREKADKEIIKAVFKITLESQSIFCIELLNDWLMLAGVFKGDPYQYRINTPGTISEKNWSLLIPLPLEDLLEHKINAEIKEMIASAGRRVDKF